MPRNMGYIGYQLRDMHASGVIASVFTDIQHPDDFIAGYVRGVNAKSVLVESITPYGRYDGWFAMRLLSIVEVTHDVAYSDRLELLLQIHGEQPSELFEQDDEDFVTTLLRYALREARVVTVWTATDAHSGYIESLDDLRVTLCALDFMGKSLGSLQIRLTDIELLSLGSEEERMNEALSTHRSN